MITAFRTVIENSKEKRPLIKPGLRVGIILKIILIFVFVLCIHLSSFRRQDGKL
jgi:hypothetical protein